MVHAGRQPNAFIGELALRNHNLSSVLASLSCIGRVSEMFGVVAS